MCGIIGVTGEADALPILLGGLHQLEYRGYDSAGVALVAGGTVYRARKARAKPVPGVTTPSPVAQLADLTSDAPRSGVQAAIGHTRWATHGQPTDTNAHPHVDCTGHLALVHNGIIENHLELKADLVAKGHHFTSATDTEVMAHLIEDHLAADRAGGLAEATRHALARCAAPSRSPSSTPTSPTPSSAPAVPRRSSSGCTTTPPSWLRTSPP